MTQPFCGPLRRNPANPHYFTDDSGKAVYLTGSHTWSVMQDIWLETESPRCTNYQEFLRMMADYGHNFLRFWQWMQTRKANWSQASTLFDPQPWERTGPGLANDGLPKFDLNRWNEAYFTRLRERIQAAGEYGIYVSVMMFEAWGIKWAQPDTDPWPYYPLHPANNVNGITDDPVTENGQAYKVFSLHCPQLLHWQKAFVQKVIDTVGDLDHVLYEVCNEVPRNPDAMAWQDHMAAFIKSIEVKRPKQHPVGITAEGGDQDNTELFATCADWVSPGNGRMYEYRYNPPIPDGKQVILTDTDHLWGHGCDVSWVWKSFTRGMNVLFMDPWEPLPTDTDKWKESGTTRNQRYYYAWDDMRRNLGYSLRFARLMNLNRCRPHNELCTSTYCLADPGEEYLFFLPNEGREGIDMRDVQGQYDCLWFDPATGHSTAGRDIAGGRSHSLNAPFTGMALCYVKRKAND